MPQILNSAAYLRGDTAVFITHDEFTPLPNVFMAPSVVPGTVFTGSMSHYGTLRTTEEMLGFPLLGQAATAPSMAKTFNLLGTGTPPPPPPTDTIKPTVNVAAPTNGAVVTTSPLALSATASDNVGVTKVEFYRAGVATPIGSSSTATGYGYLVNWDITNIANGSYSLTAKAYDAAGNNTISAPVSITINKPVTPPPTNCGTGSVPTDKGVATSTVSVAGAASYRLWSRIKAPDTTNNSYVFQLDNCAPVTVGDATSIAASQWIWVDYQSANTATKTNLDVTQGTHTVRMAGREAGVQLDKIMLIADGCIPTGTGSNCTATTVDTTPPTGVSVAAPTNGTVVTASPLVLSAAASDNVGVTKVEFYRSGSTTSIGSATATGYGYIVNWDITGVPNGAYSITAKAYDAAGNSTTSAAVSITINKPTTGDTTAPTVSITLPANGSTRTASPLELSVNASDNVGVTKVEYYRSGSTTPIATAVNSSGGWAVQWDITGLANGTYTLTAKAYDAAGNSATSAAVSFTKNIPTSTKSGDLNGDNVVDFRDMSTLFGNWGKPGTGDLNNDGTVDFRDMSILFGQWG